MNFRTNLRKKHDQDTEATDGPGNGSVSPTAPFGFFSFDETGRITEVNRSGAKMIGMDATSLLNKPFAVFIAEAAEAALFSAHLHEALIGETGAVIEIQLRRTDGRRFLARLQSSIVNSTGIAAATVRTTATNISETRRREADVKAEEERLRLALGAANVTVWDWTPSSPSVTWSAASTKAPDRGGAENKPRQWWIDRIDSEDRDHVLSTLDGAIASNRQRWAAEYRFRKAEGDWAHVHDRALIVRDESGKASRVVGAMLEITEDKLAQEELQKSHEELEKKVRERTRELTQAYELLRRIFVSITVNIAFMDRNFNYISVNRAYAEAEGHSPDFFPGRNHFDLYPDEENKAIFQRVVGTGEPYSVYEKPFPPRENTGQGVTYWDWSVQPLKDTDGSVNGLLITSVNVTNRKRAEENNLRLAAAIESAADAVVISDARGVIQYVNPSFEKITGFPRQEAIGRDLHMLDGGMHDDAFFIDLRQTIRSSGFWKGHLINKKKDGTRYTEECTYSPIRNSSGEIINYVSIKRDVSEKLLLESIAQSVDTMNNIGYIFAGVRHEIGNPVNAIHMILDVLKSKLPHLQKAAIQSYIDRALGELSRVEYLLRTLKSYNMYEQPRLQKITLREFMEKFVSVVAEDFRAKGIAVSCSIAGDAESCSADPRALQQILLNFLANASDALEGRENPAVGISVFRRDGMIRIRVEDNGCGMTEEEQKTLFKPFYTTKASGTGLGLVIVKKMLTTMKGTIEITSRKNSGTKVDIALLDGSFSETAGKQEAKKGLGA